MYCFSNATLVLLLFVWIDCNATDNEWASTNIGIFICINCSGAHRNLGMNIISFLSYLIPIEMYSFLFHAES